MPDEGNWTINRGYDASCYYIPWATGRFYTSPFSYGLTTGAAVNSLITLVPVYVPNIGGITVTSIGIEITTPGTGWVTRLGIYDCNSQGMPRNLELDCGTIGSVTATTGPVGFQSAIISKFLRQGWHFLGQVNTATTTLPSYRRFNIVGNGIFSKHGMDSPIDVTPHCTGFLSIGDAVDIANIVNNGMPPTINLISSQAPLATSQSRILVGV